MVDREKVIKGLEQFIADYKPFCGNKADWQRVYDAIALLKTQEPRVMTLEELESLSDDGVVYLECLYVVDGITQVKPAIFQPDNSSPEEDGYYCVVSSWGKTGFYHKENYNVDWRCWTYRPTDEQRQAVKWD